MCSLRLFHPHLLCRHFQLTSTAKKVHEDEILRSLLLGDLRDQANFSFISSLKERCILYFYRIMLILNVWKLL